MILNKEKKRIQKKWKFHSGFLRTELHFARKCHCIGWNFSNFGCLTESPKFNRPTRSQKSTKGQSQSFLVFILQFRKWKGHLKIKISWIYLEILASWYQLGMKNFAKCLERLFLIKYFMKMLVPENKYNSTKSLSTHCDKWDPLSSFRFSDMNF